MKPNLIIFDFDGVIIDSWHHAYEGTSRDYPHISEEEHRNLFNGNIFEQLEKMGPGKHSAEETDRWWDEDHDPKKKHLLIFDGIGETIQQLAKGCPLVINTSATAGPTKEFLIQHGLDVFERIYDNKLSLSKVEKFKQILADHNLTASNCIFITDTLGDLREASKLSVPTIVVTYGYHDRSYFHGHEEEIVGFADKPSDIIEIIDKRRDG